MDYESESKQKALSSLVLMCWLSQRSWRSGAHPSATLSART